MKERNSVCLSISLSLSLSLSVSLCLSVCLSLSYPVLNPVIYNFGDGLEEFGVWGFLNQCDDDVEEHLATVLGHHGHTQLAHVQTQLEQLRDSLRGKGWG